MSESLSYPIGRHVAQPTYSAAERAARAVEAHLNSIGLPAPCEIEMLKFKSFRIDIGRREQALRAQLQTLAA